MKLDQLFFQPFIREWDDYMFDPIIISMRRLTQGSPYARAAKAPSLTSRLTPILLI